MSTATATSDLRAPSVRPARQGPAEAWCPCPTVFCAHRLWRGSYACRHCRPMKTVSTPGALSSPPVLPTRHKSSSATSRWPSPPCSRHRGQERAPQPRPRAAASPRPTDLRAPDTCRGLPRCPPCPNGGRITMIVQVISARVLTPRLPLMHAPLRCGPLFRLRSGRCPMPLRGGERSPQPTLEALCHAGLVPHSDRLDSRRFGSLHDQIPYGYFRRRPLETRRTE